MCLFAAALDLSHHVRSLLLELSQPVPSARIDRTKFLATSARSTEEHHQAIADRALLLTDIRNNTKVRTQTNHHTQTTEAGIQAMVDNRAVLVQ